MKKNDFLKNIEMSKNISITNQKLLDQNTKQRKIMFNIIVPVIVFELIVLILTSIIYAFFDIDVLMVIGLFSIFLILSIIVMIILENYLSKKRMFIYSNERKSNLKENDYV